MFVEFLFETLEAFGGLGDRADIFLEAELLSGGGTDDLGEPPQMSRAPRGVACIADIVSEQQGVEPELGGLEIADGSFTRAAEIPNGFIFDLGHIDGGEIP